MRNGAGPGKLPLEHVAGLLSEARDLKARARAARRCQDPGRAARCLGDARLLAQEALSYCLPSGMRLSAQALCTAIELELNAYAGSTG